MKKQIKVEYIDVPAVQSPLSDISDLLDGVERMVLEFAPWDQFPYKPDVSFAIAHTGNTILVKFYVKEKYAPGRFNQVNDPVFRDSCVEIFISFEPGDNYYNIEHNISGTCLAGYKRNGYPLQLLKNELIGRIRTYSIVKEATVAEDQEWELTVVLPLEFFGGSLQYSTLNGKTAAANFYKCGDDTPTPHYLSWNLVESATPDFHLPQFFGELIFM